jgi:RecA/RadA recombinase
MENATMNEDENQVVEEIQEEVKEAQRRAGKDEDLEIEVVPSVQEPVEELPQEVEANDSEYGEKVQRRIKKLVDQRRDAENQSRQYQEQVSQLQMRLGRLEQGNNHRAENDFHKHYENTKLALKKAVEEGDTEAQVNFSEQIADMRAAVRVAEMQKSQRTQQAISPTVGRAQQVSQEPTPKKAMEWWDSNRWFNSSGFERETAAARAIDVQLDIEGYDKESDDYYHTLNKRLLNVFPELNSSTKQRTKSRSPVAPTAGGSPAYSGNRIRMTQDQLRMARELGIRDEKSLKRYADEIRKQRS